MPGPPADRVAEQAPPIAACPIVSRLGIGPVHAPLIGDTDGYRDSERGYTEKVFVAVFPIGHSVL